MLQSIQVISSIDLLWECASQAFYGQVDFTALIRNNPAFCNKNRCPNNTCPSILEFIIFVLVI